jgi:hypothetical protein
MAEEEEGIWGGERGEMGRKLTHPDAPRRVPSRHASEWGLASLLTGGFCLLLCPGTLVVWAGVISVHAERWGRADVRNICVALICCQFLVLFLNVMAIAFGAVGLMGPREERTSVALPLAGLVVSLVTILFWVVIIVSSFMTTFSLV